MIKTIIITLVLVSTALSQSCIPGRPKRQSGQQNKYVYPKNGIWFKDVGSGKYYFTQGNNIYVQRNDGFYSKWVSNGNDYVVDKNYKWTWDRQGKFYSVADDCPTPIKENQKFGIPIKCLGGQCPDQARFPSGGTWHFTNCKYYYEVGDATYELAPNGFYKKWGYRPTGSRPDCGYARKVRSPNYNVNNNAGKTCAQICPDWWTWDIRNGRWEPKPNSERKSCTYNDPEVNPQVQPEKAEKQCPPRSQKLTENIEMMDLQPPQSAFEM